MKQAAIILITHHNLGMTKDCLSSLIQNTGSPFKLFITENNSGPEMEAYLQEQGFPYEKSDRDLSIGEAINKGFHYFIKDDEVEYICWIHTDMLFAPRWLENLVKIQEKYPSAGKVCSYNFVGAKEEFDPAAATKYMFDHRHVTYPGHNAPWLMKKSTVLEVGFFDENYRGCGGYEDWDYNQRILEKSYRILQTDSSAVWHEGMGTRENIDSHSDALFNLSYYKKRWGTTGPPV